MKTTNTGDKLDPGKLAEAALALTLHDHDRAWKGLDWGLMDLLHRCGWIYDPRDKAKSVVLTETGLAIAGAMLQKHFGRQPSPDVASPRQEPR